MRVHQIEISDTQLFTATDALKLSGLPFTADDMVTELVDAAVDPSAAYRAADRLLQRLRKAGEIEFSKGKWRFRP